MDAFTIKDFTVGDRVLLHGPSPFVFGRWATVTKVGRKLLHVTIHLTDDKMRVAPRWITKREAT